MRVTVRVCPACGYWPINGEEHAQACKRCGNRHRHHLDDPPPAALPESMVRAWRAAVAAMPTVPVVVGR